VSNQPDWLPPERKAIDDLGGSRPCREQAQLERDE
jgi:hypothetical protein